MMRLTHILFILSLLLTAPIQAQYRKIIKSIEDDNFQKAEKLIRKQLDRRKGDPGALYLQSVLYDQEDYLLYDLDSAYKYVTISIKAIPELTLPDRKRLDKAGIDSLSVLFHMEKVEAEAFDRATQYNSVDRYNEFIFNFSEADQVPLAKAKRDSLAFSEFRKSEDLLNSMQYFLNLYPGAKQAPRARAIIDSLSYLGIIESRSIDTLKRFLRTDLSADRRLALEEKVFRYITIAHDTTGYQNFLEEFPESPLKTRAADYLYHLFKDDYGPLDAWSRISALVDSDSLHRIAIAESEYVVPVIQNDKYAFILPDGQQVTPALYTWIPADYFCGNVTGDYLLVGTGDSTHIIINRTGQPIFDAQVEEVTDLGQGLIYIRQDSLSFLSHKSGHVLFTGPYPEIQVIQDAFIALDNGLHWELYSIQGERLLMDKYDDIRELDAFIILEKEGNYAVTTKAEIIHNFFGQQDLQFSYTDVELLDSGLIIVKKEGFEGLLDSELKEVVPFAFHHILPLSNGYLIQSEGLYKVFRNNASEQDDEWYEKVKANINWIGKRKRLKWSVDNLMLDRTLPVVYDSLHLLSENIAFTSNEDSLYLHFANGVSVSFPKNISLRLVQSNTLTTQREYIYYVNQKEDLILFDNLGNQIFEGEAESLDVLGDQYIVIKFDDKKGLLDKDGKLLLEPEFDAIGNYENGFVSILKDRAFGLFNVKRDIYIEPAFSQIIRVFSPTTFLASKDGKWGLIDTAGEYLIEPEYEAIEPWSDSVVVAKKGYEWFFLSMNGEEINMPPVRSFNLITEQQDERIFEFYRSSGYGIYSSRRGMIIPAIYSAILNLGSKEQPLYLAESYFEEADYYVIVYYDEQGNRIRRQGFTPNAYDRIYCD